MNFITTPLLITFIITPSQVEENLVLLPVSPVVNILNYYDMFVTIKDPIVVHYCC